MEDDMSFEDRVERRLARVRTSQFYGSSHETANMPPWRRTLSSFKMAVVAGIVTALAPLAVFWVPWSILVLANPAYVNEGWCVAVTIPMALISVVWLMIAAMVGPEFEWYTGFAKRFAKQSVTPQTAQLLKDAATNARRVEEVSSRRSARVVWRQVRQAERFGREEYALQESLGRMRQASGSDPIVDRTEAEAAELQRMVARVSVALADAAEVAEAAEVQRVARRELDRAARRELKSSKRTFSAESSVDAFRAKTDTERFRVLSESEVTGVRTTLRKLDV